MVCHFPVNCEHDRRHDSNSTSCATMPIEGRPAVGNSSSVASAEDRNRQRFFRHAVRRLEMKNGQTIQVTFFYFHVQNFCLHPISYIHPKSLKYRVGLRAQANFSAAPTFKPAHEAALGNALLFRFSKLQLRCTTSINGPQASSPPSEQRRT